jgi:hypothetical protein
MLGKAVPRFNQTTLSPCTVCEASFTNSLAKLAMVPLGGQTIVSASDFQHPLEKINIVTAFPLFADWANSGGKKNTAWYLIPTAGNVFN